MSSREQGENSRGDALNHPLRQALLVLLKQHEARAEELQEATKQPLKRVIYHLGILVDEGVITLRWEGGEQIYSAQASVPLGDPDVSRVVMLTFLDAAWAALGELPSELTLTPLWEALPVDETGLVGASEVLKEALLEIQRISRISEQRCRLVDQTPRHRVVAVASLVGDRGSGAR